MPPDYEVNLFILFSEFERIYDLSFVIGKLSRLCANSRLLFIYLLRTKVV